MLWSPSLLFTFAFLLTFLYPPDQYPFYSLFPFFILCSSLWLLLVVYESKSISAFPLVSVAIELRKALLRSRFSLDFVSSSSDIYFAVYTDTSSSLLFKRVEVLGVLPFLSFIRFHFISLLLHLTSTHSTRFFHTLPTLYKPTSTFSNPQRPSSHVPRLLQFVIDSPLSLPTLPLKEYGTITS